MRIEPENGEPFFRAKLGWGLLNRTTTLFLLTILLLPAAAEAQFPATPTPDAEGRIIVTVQVGDTLWSIAARAGIPLIDLLALNNLDETALIQPGQPLLIGLAPPPPTPTPPLTPTPTRPRPTPTLTSTPPPRTAVCLLAFNDLNQNGIRDEGEPLKSGVAFTVYNETAVVENYMTTGTDEPFCLESTAPGSYQITRSVGRDERLTTSGNWSVDLLAGEVVDLAFGSYTAADAASITNSPTPPIGPASTADDIAPGAKSGDPFAWGTALLVIIGAGVLFLAGWRFRPSSNKNKTKGS